MSSTAGPNTLMGTVIRAFNDAIKGAFPSYSFQAIIATCQPKFGHYQCNNAMGIFKEVKGRAGGATSPLDAAERIVAHLDRSMFDRVDVAKTGFINITMSRQWLSERVSTMARDGIVPPVMEKKKVVVDFSSPNIAKEMHVGHLRSTIIGESLARTLEFAGHDVHRVNHVGDWGTQFGMLIAFMKDEYPNYLEQPPNISDLTAFYKAAKARFDADEPFKQRAYQCVVALQGGDAACLKAWNLFCDISRAEFEKIYQRLHVHLEEVGESFYNPYIPKTIEVLEEKGLVVEDQGAKCIFRSIKPYPLIVRKSDGGYTYDSTDMTAIWYRTQVEKADWIVYVVDQGQSEHFELVFDAARAAGWVTDCVRVDHVGFGVVLGEDGKKFKTRSGDTVRLVDLLDEAVDRARKQIEEREKEEEGDAEKFSAAEIAHAAEVIGYAAVKYADLKAHRTTNYVFSYDKMLDLRGNTAVYLEYAHARISSIARKAGIDIESLKTRADVNLVHDSEIDLAMTLCKFQETIEVVLNDLTPHKLCDLLYDTCTKFSAFWRDCRVIGDERQDSRLVLCEAVAMVLRQGFKLLAIDPLYRI